MEWQHDEGGNCVEGAGAGQHFGKNGNLPFFAPNEMRKFQLAFLFAQASCALLFLSILLTAAACC